MYDQGSRCLKMLRSILAERRAGVKALEGACFCFVCFLDEYQDGQ